MMRDQLPSLLDKPPVHQHADQLRASYCVYGTEAQRVESCLAR
jgi:hypothetical protein